MSEYEKVEIYVSKETLDRIKAVTQFENGKNLLWKPERFSSYEVSDFIVGCVNLYLKQIDKQDRYAGIDDLGKPFRLQNKFKDIAQSQGINQQRMSELTGIDPSNISLIFRNKSQPSLDYFLRIWIALKCPDLNKCLYREES